MLIAKTKKKLIHAKLENISELIDILYNIIEYNKDIKLFPSF